jgi:hypothetical protein
MRKITVLLLATILFVSCSKDNVETPANTTAPVVGSTGVVDNSTIVTYKDLEFPIKGSGSTYYNYFSTKTGKFYVNSQLNTTNGPDIDLVFVTFDGLIFFTSPDNKDLPTTIPNANNTLVINNQTFFTVADFDGLVEDSKLKTLTVVNDEDVIGTLQFPLIVIFQNSRGKKGVIKLKAINAERLLVDIKVQK